MAEDSVPATSWLALAVVALAGFVDAISYLRFAKLYASFMSGNTTALGVAVAGGDRARLGLLALVLGLFVVGVVLGTLLHRAGRRWPAALVLAVVAGLLAGASVGPFGLPLLVLGMGMLNAAVHQTSNPPLSLTFVTGALVKIGTGLANLLGGRPWPLGEAVAQVLDWLCLALGAVGGALAWQALGPRALLLAATFALLLAAATRRVPEA